MATDPFATAKSNLRDNAKTLMTVFGGVTGVLLAGTPMSGYAALKQFDEQWWIATVAVGVAFVLLGVAVALLFYALRPELAHYSQLHPPAANREIRMLQAEFADQRHDLLPGIDVARPDAPAIETIDDLLNAR